MTKPTIAEEAKRKSRGWSKGQYLHADIFEMASAYLFHLMMNHLLGYPLFTFAGISTDDTDQATE